MTIDQLEAEIKRVGSLLATAELQYAESGCFSDAGQAAQGLVGGNCVTAGCGGG